MTRARPAERAAEAAEAGRDAEAEEYGLILNLGGIVYVVNSYTKYAFNFILV